MNRKLHFLAAASATALLALTAGCGGDSTEIKTPDGSVKVDKDGDKVKVETTDGSFESGTDLPKDFPEEIKLVDGKITSATSMTTSGKAGFVVGMTSTKNTQEIVDQAVSNLEANGFETTTKTISGDQAVVGSKSDKWEVALSVGPGTPRVISYVIYEIE